MSDTPSLRMHHIAEIPLSTTMTVHARVTDAAGFRVNRLTAQTTAWSTLLLAGYANSSKTNGAPSIELDHHQPLSTVLLLCIRARRLSLENWSGTLRSRCQPPRKTKYRRAAVSSA